jgi:hypothetical protein
MTAWRHRTTAQAAFEGSGGHVERNQEFFAQNFAWVHRLSFLAIVMFSSSHEPLLLY